MADATRLPFDPVDTARQHWVGHGWASASEGMAAVTSIMRAHQIILARVDEVLRPHGLTFARYELLMLLTFSRTGSLPLAIIGSRLQVHPTSVTNAVDRLEKQGFVSRVPHPADRRATLAELTEQGRAVAAKATEDLNRDVFSRIGLRPEPTRELIEILTDLRRDAGDF